MKTNVFLFWCRLALCALFGNVLLATERPEVKPYLNFPHSPPIQTGWKPVPAFGGVSFARLLKVIPDPRNDRLFAVGRDGRVWSLPGTADGTGTSRILDIISRCRSRGDGGLVNMILHPEFGKVGSPNRGYIYLWYNYHPDPRSATGIADPTWLRLSRFTASDEGLDIDPNSELVLIEQMDEHAYHSGGGMFFHPDDGFLYISVGDEGASYGSLGNCQRIDQDLYSGILRIDVDMRGGAVSRPIQRQPATGTTANYYIPLDNPWAGQPGVLEEFFAVGLRNPHRMIYDGILRRGFVFDVGQGTSEMVHSVEREANYGWNYREGTAEELSQLTERPQNLIGVDTRPLYEFRHPTGRAIVGGVVYRGQRFRNQLGGKLIIADHNGRVWAGTVSGDLLEDVQELFRFPEDRTLSSIDVDHQGEVLISNFVDGKIYTLEAVLAGGDPLPERLSESGAFSDLSTLLPVEGLVPYEVIAPLWSDGADKLRWLSVPYEHDATNGSNAIGFSDRGAWSFPPGTVWVKHFAIRTNLLDPKSVRRLETRFIVQQEEGVYGVTYRWNEEQTEAYVLPEGLSEAVPIQTLDGVVTQNWTYPSMANCMECHNANAGHVLGVSTRQLNWSPEASGHAGAGNQILRLHDAGLISDLNGWVGQEVLVDPADVSQPLTARVRSYLDANCSHCHRSGGERASFDARAEVALPLQGLLFGDAEDNLGIAGASLIHPGRKNLSTIFQRVHSNEDPVRMPPLARNVVDSMAVSLLEEWIESMSGLALEGITNGMVVKSSQATLPVVARAEGHSTLPEATEIYLDGGLLGSCPEGDCAIPLTALAPGQRELQVFSYWNDGSVEASPVTKIEVVDDAPGRLTQPAANAVYAAGLVPVTVEVGNEAEVSDLEVVVDGITVAALAGPPFTTWIELASGEHVIGARWKRAGQENEEGAPSVGIAVTDQPVIRFVNPQDKWVLVPAVNLVTTPLDEANEAAAWRGYFSKVPGMQPGVPDPWGFPAALRIPSADRGGFDGNASGIYHVADPLLTNGTYLVNAWLRTTERNLAIQVGLNDYARETFFARPSWAEYTQLYDYTICDCNGGDNRVFQVFERTANNPDWEVARPRVFYQAGVNLSVQGPASNENAILQDGAELVVGNGAETQHVWYFRKPGLYALTARSRDSLGGTLYSRPLFIQVGPAPVLTAVSQHLIQVTAEPGEYLALESSIDLGQWHEEHRWEQTAPIVDVQLGEDTSSPQKFVRVRWLVRPQ